MQLHLKGILHQKFFYRLNLIFWIVMGWGTSTGRIIGQVESQDYPAGIYEQIQGSCAGNRLYTRSLEAVGSEDEFTEIGEAKGVHDVGWAFGPTLLDIDGDGLLDIYSTTGFMSFDRGKPDGWTCLWRAVVTQPMDRTCRIPQLGEIDSDNGEFWVENPFEMPEKGENLSAYERNRVYLNAGNLEFIDASFASAYLHPWRCSFVHSILGSNVGAQDREGSQKISGLLLVVGKLGSSPFSLPSRHFLFLCTQPVQKSFSRNDDVRWRRNDRGNERESTWLNFELIFDYDNADRST